MAPYWETTVTWAEADPRSTSMVTRDPAAQKAGAVAVRAPLRTREVCDPAGSRAGEPSLKVRGPAVVPSTQVRFPPDVIEHGDSHRAGPVPVLVPAKTTSQEVAAEQEMGLPPVFLTETDIATGEADAESPAFRDAPTMEMLELEVAALTRL